MRALLIGTNFYRPGGIWPSLSGCVRDAGRVEELLRQILGVPAERIRKLTASAPLDGASEPPEPPEDRPTYETLVAELLRLVRTAEPGEQVLIYFAGHGGRVPTCIPEVRGRAAFDEVLVPYDAAAPSARCLRDVEIGAILRALVERGALVTVFLDCCHAGAAGRLAEIPPGIGVLGSGIVDERAWPVDGLLAPLPSLAATWRDLGGGPMRNLTLGSGWQPDPRGYVLLAACRAAELAFEFPFEGREKRGVFTRALLEGLRNLTPDFTYRRLYDRIVAEVHGRFEAQTPVLEGDEDRVVFGDGHVRLPPAVNVVRVERGGKRLLLSAGRAQGIERRARFAIEGAAVAQVTVAGATESWARVVETVRSSPIVQGARAVPLAAGAFRLRRRVRLCRAPSATGQKTLEAVAEILEAEGGRGFIGLAGEGEGTDFLLSVDPRDRCEVRDPAGALLPYLPRLFAGGGGAPQSLVDLLIHLAKYRNVQQLDNRSWLSPLRGALLLEAGRLPEDWAEGQPPVFDAPLRSGGSPIPCGRWICIRIANTSAQELSLGALDLQPDWGVSQLLPGRHGGDFLTLGPGEDHVVALRTHLPGGLAAGTDLLKVVAAAGPVGLRWLEMPALDAVSPRRSAARPMLREPLNELEALFAALMADRAPRRSLEPSRSPGREWAVAHLELPMTR